MKERELIFLILPPHLFVPAMPWLKVSNVEKNGSDLNNDWKMEPNNDEKWQGDWEINEAGRKDLSLEKIIISLWRAIIAIV